MNPSSLNTKTMNPPRLSLLLYAHRPQNAFTTPHPPNSLPSLIYHNKKKHLTNKQTANSNQPAWSSWYNRKFHSLPHPRLLTTLTDPGFRPFGPCAIKRKKVSRQTKKKRDILESPNNGPERGIVTCAPLGVATVGHRGHGL
jgi:hypothetical protein